VNFRGFDTQKIRSLADAMKALAPGARKLHGDLAGTLFEAQMLLGGKPATTSPLLEPLVGQVVPIFQSGVLISLQQEMDDTSASMKRRCDQLEACGRLEAQGYHLSSSVLFADTAAPDPRKVKEALKYFDDHIDDSGGFLWSNSAQGAQEVLDHLKGLTPAELSAVLSGLSPQQLKKLNDQLGEGSSWWGAGDRDNNVRVAWANLLLGGAAPETLAKILPELSNLEPDLHSGGSKGLTYQPVNGSLFGPNGVIDIKHDLRQGYLGDCWFLSSLAAIAERDPDYLKEHIRQNPNGTFTVTFYRTDVQPNDGPSVWQGDSAWTTKTTPVEITVDNRLPCYANGTPGYAQTPDSVMWVAIYEKAYAQYVGGYSKPDEGGFGDEGMNALTGLPTHRSDAGDTSLAQLSKQIQEGDAVTSGTKDDKTLWFFGGSEYTDADKLVTSHEYSVEHVNMDAHPPTITLLNPWGSGSVDSATHQPIPQEVTLTESEWHKYFDTVSFTKTRV
jgi:hypothetical protein